MLSAANAMHYRALTAAKEWESPAYLGVSQVRIGRIEFPRLLFLNHQFYFGAHANKSPAFISFFGSATPLRDRVSMSRQRPSIVGMSF